MSVLLLGFLLPQSLSGAVFSKVFEVCYASGYPDRISSVADWFRCVDMAVPADEKVRFVQIGANDGVFWDPLHVAITASTKPYSRWRGVLVEPVPSYMLELRKNYAEFGSEFSYVQAAINATCSSSRTTFFMPDFHHNDKNDEEHEWLRGIGSLALPPGRQETGTYKRITVDCLTPKNLAVFVKRHDVTQPHIMLVDAEGHDELIIQAMSSWPFGKPLLIAFETWDGVCKMDDIYRFLNLHGYIVIHVGNTQDYVAVYVKSV
jgi:hypothetical protein